MIRIYPIRKTRNHWNIYFYCKHICNQKCEILILNNSYENNLSVSRNPDFNNGFCSSYLNIEKSPIRLSTFDKDNPTCENGQLFNSEQEVIPDSSFTISLFYPFSFIFDIYLTSSGGFKLKDLIYSIKILYKFIYEEEERTATPQLFSLKRTCSSCGVKNLSDYADEKNDEDNDDQKGEKECPICFCDYKEDDDIYTLKCNHYFHKECIEKWVKNSGTCPLCRYNIFLCDKCSGKGLIYYQYSGVVIPFEERGNIMNRNQSNGVFGIHTYDFEDLILNSMYYDNVKKKLFIDISG